MGLQSGKVLKVVKPLYGTPKSGLNWCLTYLSHHLDALGMKGCRAGPKVLMQKRDRKLDGLVQLKVDDSLGLGSDAFLDKEDTA